MAYSEQFSLKQPTPHLNEKVWHYFLKQKLGMESKHISQGKNQRLHYEKCYTKQTNINHNI